MEIVRRSDGIIAILVLVLATWPIATSGRPDPWQPSNQIPLNEGSSAQSRRVAIIGAGAAGSSTAYHLQQFASNKTIPLDITIYEASSRIGGRTTTVNALDQLHYPAELGASIFAQVNHILVDAAKEFGLTTVSPGADRPRGSKYEIGIWDGREFLYKSASDGPGWLDMVKLFWRYGLAPIKTQRLMKNTVAKFLMMYNEPVFPWKSLTDVAMQVGLLDTTASTGRQLLKLNGISESFGREIIQASTRVNYGQNLGLIHGLETLVCMATDGAMAVQGGNWRIFEGMANRSLAEVKLNSRVEKISRLQERGYWISSSDGESHEQGSEFFDHVVIAAPFQYSSIEVSPPLQQPPAEIPYVTLFVTLLSSPHRLSPVFFSTFKSPPSDPDQADIPDMIVTTLPADLDLGSSPRGVGPTGFWSISTLRTVEVNASMQYLYKIFSPKPLTAKFLSDLLDFPLEFEDNAVRHNGIQAIAKKHISWLYEKKWQSYPFEYPRITFEELNLDGSGLWYTGGMESFISTMETSALMGRNVARLIVDEHMDERDGGMETSG